MNNKAITVAALLGLSATLASAQDCTAQLASVTASLDSVQGSLDKIKKGVKVAAIVVPILGGLLLILLGLVIYLLVRGLRKIKRKLPVPPEWGFIRFIRNIDKLELNVNTGVAVDVKLTKDEEKSEDEEEKRRKREEEEEKRKKKEEEEKRKKREEHKRREEKEDDEETRKRRRERKGKSDREFNLRLELSNKGSLVIRRKDIDIDDSYLYARTIFHVTYRGKFKGDDVVIRKFSFPIDSDDLILQEIFEEDQRRNKLNGLKHDNLVHHIGTIADEPDYAFVTKYYSRGSLYADLVERKSKVNFSAKEIAKIALDIATAVRTLHKHEMTTRVVASRNVFVEKESNGSVRARLDLNFEPSTAGFLYGRQHAYIGPVSWLAPEAIESKKYTPASDSFSFGVFLWELVARADPFEERSHVGVACPLIHKGLRLKVPEDAPQVFKDLIASCFEEDPKARPSSEDILKELKEYYESL